MPEGPDFGPRGYLPERAAKRARKIILREQMSLGWPIAALIAGLLLSGLGLVYLMTRAGPPAAPYVDVGPLDQVDPRGAGILDVRGSATLVVRAGGGVRAYRAPRGAVTHCPQSGLLEAPEGGQVWTLGGRLIGGDGESLRPLPAQVHAGRLWINPEHPAPSLAPDPQGVTPTCR